MNSSLDNSLPEDVHAWQDQTGDGSLDGGTHVADTKKVEGQQQQTQQRQQQEQQQ